MSSAETNKPTNIECPKCGFDINVESSLRDKVGQEVDQQYRQKWAQQEKSFQERDTQLKQQQQEHDRARKDLDNKIKQGVDSALTKERNALQEQIRKELQDEQSSHTNAMRKELDAKSEKIKGLLKAEVEVERLKRENEEQKLAAQVENEQKFSQRLREERGKIEQAEQQKAESKIGEHRHIVEQLKQRLQEAQRQAAQGSVQLQGEVQELAIEEWLNANFPDDTIEEVRKGQRGPDCLQTVHTRERQNCGVICYESKRTKSFQPSWINKLLDDMRDCNADFGVLVTATMPTNMESVDIVEGVWVCDFEAFKILSGVLRYSVIQISHARSVQENRGDKMVMLYNYLTSNEFNLQITGIVNGFQQMQKDLDTEKRSMQAIWKKREKQIERVLYNSSSFYGNLRGIAGDAIPHVEPLELPDGENNPTPAIESPPGE